MKTGDIKNKFNEFVEEQPSKLLESIAYRQRNKQWLDESARIALMILKALRAKEMSQKDLADLIDVTPQYINKVVKGAENLTLETIKKLENVLDLKILVKQEVVQETIVIIEKEYIFTSYIEKQRNEHEQTVTTVFKSHYDKQAKEFSEVNPSMTSAA